MLEKHREKAIAAVLRIAGDRSEAEDCVQEALLRLAQRQDLDPRRVGSLLTRTSIHIAIDRMRSRRRGERAHRELLGSLAAEVIQPDEVVGHRDEVERALAAIDTLPARERQVLLMRLHGFSVAEIAGLLGLSPKSVEGAFTRARARVRLIVGGALAWIADRIRRLTTWPCAETVAAAFVVVLTAGPLWGHDTTGPATTLQIRPSGDAPAPVELGGDAGHRLAKASDGGSSEPIGRRDSATAARNQGGRNGHPYYFATPSLYVPAAPGPGGSRPPLISGGSIWISWGPQQTLDPVNGIQKCLAQGGPRIALQNGGCDT